MVLKGNITIHSNSAKGVPAPIKDKSNKYQAENMINVATSLCCNLPIDALASVVHEEHNFHAIVK